MTDTTIFHTCATSPKLDECEDKAPEFSHGMVALPDHLWHTKNYPWFLDNGAYTAWQSGDEWDVDGFLRALRLAEDYSRPPEWVVVPDPLGNTGGRSRQEWIEEVRDRGFTPAVVCHGPDDFHTFPEDVPVVFLGGVHPQETRDWRRRASPVGERWIDTICRQAHEDGKHVHVGRPGVDLGFWIDSTDADSLDTSSIIRRNRWERLERIRPNTGLARFASDGGGSGE